MSPKKPVGLCRYPGCGRKVNGYCEEHKHLDNSFKNKKADRWYNLPIWKGNTSKPLGQRGGMRERQLMSVPYCEECKRNGIIKDITGKGQGVADHITPFRSVPKEHQWAYFTDPNNHQSLCASCHQRKLSGE